MLDADGHVSKRGILTGLPGTLGRRYATVRANDLVSRSLARLVLLPIRAVLGTTREEYERRQSELRACERRAAGFNALLGGLLAMEESGQVGKEPCR